ncbi:MAG: ABC transporter ATP-binding protein [Acinetobacter sp.]
MRFTYADKIFKYVFKYRINFLVGDSATGKSFVSRALEGSIVWNKKDVTERYYFDKSSTPKQHRLDLARAVRGSVVILDEAYIRSLCKCKMLQVFLQAPATFIVISRELSTIGSVPISPQQCCKIVQDEQGISRIAPAYPHWKLPADRTAFVSEDSGAGNSIWSAVLNVDVCGEYAGNSKVMRKLLASTSMMGCVDTLSLSGSMSIFETMYASGEVPIFDIPSIEYLVMQSMHVPERIDNTIYMNFNPERECTRLLSELTQHTYSKTALVGCPLVCTDCNKSECIGKQINIVQGMQTYLKQLHPEYTFPWETKIQLGDQRTNLFKSNL